MLNFPIFLPTFFTRPPFTFHSLWSGAQVGGGGVCSETENSRSTNWNSTWQVRHLLRSPYRWESLWDHLECSYMGNCEISIFDVENVGDMHPVVSSSGVLLKDPTWKLFDKKTGMLAVCSKLHNLFLAPQKHRLCHLLPLSLISRGDAKRLKPRGL